MKKFEDIRYAERIGKYGKTLGVSMPGGFWVFKNTMKLARASAYENWANIDWAKRQCAETIIGSNVWQSQVDGAKKALGRAIRFLVKHDLLPLRLVLAKTRNGKPYKGGKRLYVRQTADADALPVLALPAIRGSRNRELLAQADWAALGKTTPTLTIGGTLP